MPRIAAHHANRDLGDNGPTRMRFRTIVARTRSLARDNLQAWRRKFSGRSKSRKCYVGGKSEVEKESDSSEDDESRSLEHKTIVTVRSYDERVVPDTGDVSRSSRTTDSDCWDGVASLGDSWNQKSKDPLPHVKPQSGIPPARFPRLSGNFFPQIASLGDSCGHDRARNDDDLRITGDRMELAGLHPRRRSDDGRCKFQNLAPIAYEDIVKARAAAKRRRSLPRAAREMASTVHPANSRAGSSRDSLPSKQEARPLIAVAREGEHQRVFGQGKDEVGKVFRVSDTDIDGEPSSLLDAEEEDYMDSLLLEA